jgi:tetratricopeptide (TPR) repeat protein
MFRRFFPRKDKGRAPDPQHTDQPGLARPLDPAEAEEARQNFAQFLPHPEVDDGVHRMALRTGEQKLPDDPDELAYAGDQGEHAELARDALQAGDLRRSIYHLALACDPEHEEWLALLDQWIAAAGPRALELVPLYDKEYFPTLQASQRLMQTGNTPGHRMEVIPIVGKNYHAKVAVHAYILVAQGRIKEGVTLLLQLMQVKPEIPYITWLTRWQNRPGFVDALDPTKVAAIAMHSMHKYPGSYLFSEEAREELSRHLPLLRASYLVLAQQPEDGRFLTTAFAYAAVLRKTGAFEEAAGVARTLPASYQTRVSLAMAEEALGNLEASIAAYREALTFDPNDVAVRNDLGTLHLIQGKLDEALALYEESARLDPTDPYQQAHAHIAYLRYLQAPSSEQLLDLQKLARSQETARKLLSLLQVPYAGKLPEPGEALINLMRTIKTKRAAGEARMPDDGKVKAGLSSLEAPSAHLAARRMLDSWGFSFELAVSDVYIPDPRLPLRPVEYQIWRYHEYDPEPAVPAPDPAIAEQISSIAQTPYILLRWYAQAHILGQRLGEAALRDLLGAMVHPPTTPASWDEWNWITAVQIASALTIASLGDDTAWEGSRRKAALTSLIYGPTDWSGAAALIALAVLAGQNKRITIEFDHICRDLWSLGRGTGEWPHEQAMVFGLLFVNLYSKEARKYIQEYFERMQKESQ